MTPSGKIIGAAVGLLGGLVFVLAGWRIALILLGLGFTLAGCLVGAWLDSREDIRRRVRGFIQQASSG